MTERETDCETDCETTGANPVAPSPGTVLGLETAPGVSTTATSSSRWRRMLDAGSRDAGRPAFEGAFAARTITFLVGAEGRPDVSAGVLATGEAPADRGHGTVVELATAASRASRDRIAAALAEARTGWRFRVVGDEPSLGALRAILHEAGVLDEEITLVLAPPASEVGRVLVSCGHCQSKTLGPGAANGTGTANGTGAANGTGTANGTVTCAGCGLQLTIYYHFSRRQGAYLGYFADAELAATPQPAREPSQLAFA